MLRGCDGAEKLTGSGGHVSGDESTFCVVARKCSISIDISNGICGKSVAGAPGRKNSCGLNGEECPFSDCVKPIEARSDINYY